MRKRAAAAKWLFWLALTGCLLVAMPAAAQEAFGTESQKTFPQPTTELRSQSTALPAEANFHFQESWMPLFNPGYIAPPVRAGAANFNAAGWNSSPNRIERMESAFYCNDTPFVDQVRLPLATFWSGRVKLVGFESDVTTANFVLGLPGQGALHNLSAFGNAFIATHTPPSDQLAGIHLTFSLRPTGADYSENSGRHGIEYLVRAGRTILPFRNARSEFETTSMH